MADEKSRFTSDRRVPSASSWAGEDDWGAGSSVGLDVVNQDLVPRETVDSVEVADGGTYDFSTFDSSVWTTHSDASYDASSERVSMVSGNNRNGELEFNSGITESSWFCAWDNVLHGGNYEFQQLLFYADAIGTGGDNEDTVGIAHAYRVEVNYNGSVTLTEIVDEGEIRLSSASTSTSTHAYRLEYEGGIVRFYVDGAEKLNHTLSSPNTQHPKLYFKSVTGRNSSSNSIDNVTIGGL